LERKAHPDGNELQNGGKTTWTRGKPNRLGWLKTNKEEDSEKKVARKKARTALVEPQLETARAKDAEKRGEKGGGRLNALVAERKE